MKSNLSLIYSAFLIFFIAALFSSSSVNAQTFAVFHLKDSTVRQAEIVANSKDVVFISGGSIKLADIKRVELQMLSTKIISIGITFL